MSTVVTSPVIAVDFLLDARRSIQTVQESDLPGGALYNQCAQILTGIDKAIAGLRRAK
jgi:hypothetical protein